VTAPPEPPEPPAPTEGPAPRLTAVQLATFVARGFLRFDSIIPHPLCAEALREIETNARPGAFGAAAGDKPGDEKSRFAGRPLQQIWPDGAGIAALVRLPVVRGIIDSLLGPGALYDHHHAHTVEAQQRWSQPWHADAIIDPRTAAFDIQLFFFFHDTPREMGGTMILPGSHLRRVHESDIARYQNFLGQLPTVCPAGSLLVCHHGIWHCGQPNHTRARRHMLKLRLNPSAPQRFAWTGVDGAAAAAVRDALTTPEPWHGNEARLEIVNRLRLWRQLTGDQTFDADHWLTRLELPPAP
jgi:hypothetical protein